MHPDVGDPELIGVLSISAGQAEHERAMAKAQQELATEEARRVKLKSENDLVSAVSATLPHVAMNLQVLLQERNALLQKLQGLEKAWANHYMELSNVLGQMNSIYPVIPRS